MAGWYIRRGEKILGPVEVPKLQELAAAGKLLPTDQLAKDVAGPWKEARQTSLFAKPKATTNLVSKPEAPPPVVVPATKALPTVADPQPTSGTIGQVTYAVFGTLGRGMLATSAAISRRLAIRSQRKHEIKLAKIQAKAISDVQRQSNQVTPQSSSLPPAAAPPQIVQQTIVKVVNKNTANAYGCSGCATILLLIIIAIVIAGIMSSAGTR